MDKIAEWAAELQSLAQAGLYYAKDDFDRERFERVRQIAAEMMAERTGLPLGKVTELFCADSGYQTPKVDTRAAVFRDGKILLVQEHAGGERGQGGPRGGGAGGRRQKPDRCAGSGPAQPAALSLPHREALLPLRGARRRIPGKQRDARQRLLLTREAAPARCGEMLRGTGPPVLRRGSCGKLARCVRLSVGFIQRACFFDALPV